MPQTDVYYSHALSGYYALSRTHIALSDVKQPIFSKLNMTLNKLSLEGQ